MSLEQITVFIDENNKLWRTKEEYDAHLAAKAAEELRRQRQQAAEELVSLIFPRWKLVTTAIYNTDYEPGLRLFNHLKHLSLEELAVIKPLFTKAMNASQVIAVRSLSTI